MATPLSLQINQILDILGFEKSIIRLKQTKIFAEEKVKNAFIGPRYSVFYTGSTAEGFCGDYFLNRENSDFDVMISLNEILNVVQEETRAEESKAQNRFIVRTMHANVSPGHVRLEVLLNEKLALTSSIVQKDKSRLYLSSEKALKDLMPLHEGMIEKYHSSSEDCISFGAHGPASSIIATGNGEFAKRDIVCAFPCHFWPHQAKAWLLRERNWPCSNLMEKITSLGCHIVPAGFPGSKTESLEWRFSFVAAERLLMWSLNDTQRKCYYLMKIVNKNLLSKDSVEVVSSYHLKTTLFWIIEEASPSIWIKSELITCLKMCLSRLLDFIVKRNCPNFFISDANLMDREIFNTESRDRLVKLLNIILIDIYDALNSCPSLYRINKTLTRIDQSLVWKSHMCLQWLLWNNCFFNEICGINSVEFQKTIMDKYRENQTMYFMNYVLQVLDVKYDDPMHQLFIQPFIRLCHTLLGILHHIEISKMTVADEEDLEIVQLYIDDAKTHFDKGHRANIMGKLRFANFEYMYGRIESASVLLKQIDSDATNLRYNIEKKKFLDLKERLFSIIDSLLAVDSYGEDSVSIESVINDDTFSLIEQICNNKDVYLMEEKLSDLKIPKEFRVISWLTTELTFFAEEIKCVPRAIQYELCVGSIYNTVGVVVCNARIFHMALTWLVQKKLGKTDSLRSLLSQMVSTIKDIPKRHQNVALNFIAWLYIESNDLAGALEILNRSFRYTVEPKTLLWLYGIILNKQFGIYNM